MASAIPLECQMPGEGYDFQDVTALFVEAAAGMSRIDSSSGRDDADCDVGFARRDAA